MVKIKLATRPVNAANTIAIITTVSRFAASYTAQIFALYAAARFKHFFWCTTFPAQSCFVEVFAMADTTVLRQDILAPLALILTAAAHF